MKKVSKTLSLLALCAVMIIMSVVPAFASTTYVEDHSKIDCVHRYKGNDGYFYFEIKIPKDIKKIYINVAFTKNSEGDEIYRTIIEALHDDMTFLYSDETSEYYLLKTHNIFPEGIGIKLYCNYNGTYYMATDNGNGQTKEGRGYWLSA